MNTSKVLDIETIEKEKHFAEQKIQQVLAEFTGRTGWNISRIQFSFTETATRSGTYRDAQKVEVVVEL